MFFILKVHSQLAQSNYFLPFWGARKWHGWALQRYLIRIRQKQKEAGAQALWDPVTRTSSGPHLTELIPSTPCCLVFLQFFMESQRITSCLCSAKLKPSLKALRLLPFLHSADFYNFVHLSTAGFFSSNARLPH